MKRTTIWKIAASVLLIAVCLPIFSPLAPTPATALTVVAPLPYAMEQYGQHHSGIFNTATAPTLDGAKDSSYTLIDSFDDSSGNYNGIFVASTEDGSKSGEIATEWIPDKMDIYGAYDANYVYLYIETTSRSDESYSITPKFGFNFTESQKDAQEGVDLGAFSISNSEAEVSGTDYVIKTALNPVGGNDSTGVYSMNDTVYEFRFAWDTIAPEGKEPETDFSRMYFTLVMPFDDGTEEGAYWIYGVPNNAALPNDVQMKEAFGENAGTYTPNVINLLGSAVDTTVFPYPIVTNVERTDNNTNQIRSFKMTFIISGAAQDSINRVGAIFMNDTSKLGISPLTAETSGAAAYQATLVSSTDNVSTYSVEFSTTADCYNSYFSIRPYVKYSGLDSILYGDCYSNTPSYYDVLNSEYNQYLKVLMIGCSFSSYYKDELRNICKSEGIHLTLARTYSSGAKAYQHWDWLMNDYTGKDDFKFEVISPNGTIHGYTHGKTMKEMIHYYNDWDVITVQDHYGIEYSNGDTYAKGMASSMSFMANLFRYLDVNFPNTDLYIHHTWAFQLGYGYKNGTAVLNEDGTAVLGGTVNGSSFEPIEKRMMTVEQQTNHHNNIVKIVRSLSEKLSVPLIPSGDAWAIARANEIIGDTLCDGKNGAIAGDYYHDGEAGGQYLNALVYYEMLTGRDARKVTYIPSYDHDLLTEERAVALREAAHQAVEEYKQLDSWKNATINKN